MESILLVVWMMTLNSVDALKCFGATPRGDQLVECFPEATHCFTAYGVYKKSGRKATMKGCFDDRPCTLEHLWELFVADSQFWDLTITAQYHGKGRGPNVSSLTNTEHGGESVPVIT
ncbi:hypothetical protein AAVH_29186 [Aphelenchoides avenae]|nr:hypothetical protein AAVH_29186 [Aphelenchus avenae]